MDVILVPVLLLLKTVISLAVFVVIADVIFNWLMIARVFNPNNQFVYMVSETLSKISDMMLEPIRRNIPTNVGMLDLSPVVLILFLTLVENIINRILLKF